MFGELMRWNPSQELSSWHRDIDELFGRFFGGPEASLGSWMPRIETYRKDNDYVVRLDLPGVDPKDVQVHAEGNVLAISGERKTEEKGQDYQETSYGKFERTVICREAWKRTRFRPAVNMAFLKSGSQYRRNLLDGRSRF